MRLMPIAGDDYWRQRAAIKRLAYLTESGVVNQPPGRDNGGEAVLNPCRLPTHSEAA